MNARVKIDFKGKSVPVKLQKMEKVVKCMTNNPYYENPNPTLEDFKAANVALHDAAQEAANGGTDKTTALYAREKEADQMYSLMAAYVQSASGGDAEKIISSGYDVQNTRTPSTLPEQPQNVVAKTSTYAGEILLKWKKVDNAKSYSIEKSADGSTGWAACGTSTKANIPIDGLTSLSYVWFRVTAIGSAGPSPVSEAARGMVA